jgi:AhpD family alkylhydroperoxidase
VATTPRIPQEYLDGFFMQMESAADNPATQIAIPIELSRLAGIPVQTRASFRLSPVLHELIRIYNAKVQDCQYCQNARQAVAVQAGLAEDMVEALGHFEDSNLPESVKAALRLTAAISTNPGLITDELWADAASYYSETELVDIVLLSMHTTASKVTITLGLDPGKERSSRLFFPTEDVYGTSPELTEAIEALRKDGILVAPPTDAPVSIGATLPTVAGSSAEAIRA